MTAALRSATAADTALIRSLVCELADYEHRLHEVELTETALHAALFCADPRVFCTIVEWTAAGEPPQPAGFALWYYTFSTFLGQHGIYLEDLFVRPSYRGSGLGKALLADLAARCVAGGLGRLEWSVLDWNEPSIAFYKAQGAVLLDEWTRCRISGAALDRLAERS